MIAAIFVYLPKSVSLKIDNIRKEYDPKYHRIKPHITIVPPFKISPEELSKRLKNLEKEIETIKPFEIEIGDVGFFTRNRKYLPYLKAPHPELERIKKLGLKHLLRKNNLEVRNTIFHITLGRDVRKKEIENILAKASKLKGRKIKIEKIFIVSINNNEPWQIYKELILKNRNKPNS